MRSLLLAFLCSTLLSASAHAQDQWYKGVTHVHSLWSDGDAAPEVIAAWYVEHGYHFVAFSDHNILQEGEKLFPVTQDGRLKPAHVEDIRVRFGEDWLDTRVENDRETMRLKTRVELKARFEEPGGFLILPGEEITSGGGGPHVNAINLRELIPGEVGGNAELMQRYIDTVRAQSARYGVPMMTHVNHVNFADGVTTEELLEVRGLEFFEVYNGHPSVFNWGNPSKGMPSTELHWDVIQSMIQSRDPGYTLYGLATDDSHHYHEWQVGRSNPGRGWVMVRAAKLESNALVEAMQRGDFYSSTGVMLTRIERGADALAFTIDGEEGVVYTTQFIGTRRGFSTESQSAQGPRGSRKYSDEIGAVLFETTDLTPRYEFSGDELYVRARVLSDKVQPNPFAEGDNEMAWIQPVIVQGK